ncbi:helix-turn-helix domain-containing protein [Actinomadura parmotrematis]|uniref:Helix-turn-helix domain-containing protein n=1 Tax=Actinomadura parmotrematis TaxID=2864039 RepID=A0ABS7FQM8_9ACTN|nr:helix-turn-helix domain-containing protein [Actinomadura parmotrematis]MBW8482702.1 hypothetical protein [Actinomadura parmotrematis]
MDTHHASAGVQAPPEERRTAGVRRVKARHDAHFTIIPNGLAQQNGLSLRARGLALFLLSMPDGTDASIKGLAATMREGQTAIAAALRELEAAGYLIRALVRDAHGQVSTRTVLWDVPAADAGTACEATPPATPDAPEPRPRPVPARLGSSARGVPAPQPAAPSAPPRALTGLTPVVPSTALPTAPSAVTPAITVVPKPRQPCLSPSARGVPAPESAAPAAPPRALAELTPPARLLLEATGSDARLTLGATEIPGLAELVDQALTAGVPASHIRERLTTGLPPNVRHPAALLRHRLTEHLPIWRAAAALRAAPEPPAPRLAECTTCRDPLRHRTPDGLCTACRRSRPHDMPSAATDTSASRSG